MWWDQCHLASSAEWQCCLRGGSVRLIVLYFEVLVWEELSTVRLLSCHISSSSFRSSFCSYSSRGGTRVPPRSSPRPRNHSKLLCKPPQPDLKHTSFWDACAGCNNKIPLWFFFSRFLSILFSAFSDFRGREYWLPCLKDQPNSNLCQSIDLANVVFFVWSCRLHCLLGYDCIVLSTSSYL